MKDLKKISEILSNASKDKSNKKDLFGKISGEKTKKLLNGIVANHFKDDHEASQELYSKVSKVPDKKYLMLKGRLKKKMIEESFYINPFKKKRSPYEAAMNEGYRNLSIAKTFLSVGLREEAIELVKPLFQVARQYCFTDLLLATARLLRYHSSLTGTRDEMVYYDKVLNETQQELDAEIYSEKVMEELNMEARFSYSVRMDLAKHTGAHYERLAALKERFRSHTLHLNFYRIGIRYHEYMQDYQGIITVCETCEAYLIEHPQFKQDVRFAEMALFKMDACLHLQDYTKGREYALVCNNYFSKGYPNWFVFMEYYFLLGIQTRNYSSCLEVFKEVTGHIKFRNINPERKEKWKLFEAYLNVVLPEELRDVNFKLYKFINEVPIYNRDKKGYNLSILIAQFMMLLRMKDHDRLILKQDSFRTYFSRYVKKKNNYRSYYFTKMLFGVLRYNFDVEKVDQNARKFLIKLNVKTNRYHGDLESLEVIPYEQLWKEVLKLLHVNDSGSRFFIQLPAKRGRKKKPVSKNLDAAIKYKEKVLLESSSQF